MGNNHIITREIGNLRGFSTDSIFLRPANVADVALNIQRSPDGTFGPRRGYQCRVADIGGLGTGTFDNPRTGEIQTVTINDDGQLYNLLNKQIYLYYDGQHSGVITGISNANPAVVDSAAHGLSTGTRVLLQDIGGMTALNNNIYTITVINPNQFSLDGVDSLLFPAYTMGGTWTIAFTQNRYLTFTIFTDPRFLNSNLGWSFAPWSFSPWGAPSGESITCNITVNQAAQIVGNQLNVNTINVELGHELATGDVVLLVDINGVQYQRNVIGTTASSVTIDGSPISVFNGIFINQFFDIPFRKGFDVVTPFTLQDFINIITNPITGVFGLQVAANGFLNFPAAFLQITEPTIIVSNSVYTLQYYYWEQCNRTVAVTFLGSASTVYQDSDEFENASFATFDDCVYIANGIDFPQKFDGQTVYRAGMPQGPRPFTVDNTGATIEPFSMGEVYTYAATYEQVDNLEHIVEGAASERRIHTVGTTPSAINITVENILSNSGWNTNGALAVGGAATVYGPDADGFYYDAVSVLNSPHTMKIGDIAFYNDTAIAVVNGNQVGVNTIDVNAGHGVQVLDTVIFQDTTPNVIMRVVSEISPTSITIRGDVVSVNNGTTISANTTAPVFGNIAIVDGAQSNVNIVNVLAGHSIQLNDLVNFTDSFNRLQRRTALAVGATTVTLSGIPVSVSNLSLFVSETIRATVINLQRSNSGPATLGANAPISNNLRINIYRTENGVDELLYLTTLPNNSLGSATQTYVDSIADTELGFSFPDPVQLPNPPPISKYLLTFGNQLLYAGGKLGDPTNSDLVFFSKGEQPEAVPLASNAFSVPSPDDDVTGLGASGTTLIVFKNRAIYAVTGDLLTSQFQVTPLAPGTNIGCVANATVQSVGSLLYFLHTNGVYAITENQFYPTDPFGNPIAISLAIEAIFRQTNFLPQTRYVLKRAVALNYTKDNQYLLFLPAEDTQTSQRVANANSLMLCYDYQAKNWFEWRNINAAGGMFTIDDNLFFHERRFSGIVGNTANLYKQHRFYRLIDYADHTSALRSEWRSSWEDLGQPEVRKKFVRTLLLIDRFSDLQQLNIPNLYFSSYLDRIPNLQNTIAIITTVDNIKNSSWSFSPWGWGIWAGYQDSFARVNLKAGTVAKSIQIGFALTAINTAYKLAGFQLEAVPEFRKTIQR